MTDEENSPPTIRRDVTGVPKSIDDALQKALFELKMEGGIAILPKDAVIRGMTLVTEELRHARGPEAIRKIYERQNLPLFQGKLVRRDTKGVPKDVNDALARVLFDLKMSPDKIRVSIKDAVVRGMVLATEELRRAKSPEAVKRIYGK